VNNIPTQHDQVSIQTVDDVPCVGVVTRLRALITDKLHDFMFTLVRNTTSASSTDTDNNNNNQLPRQGHLRPKI
jgi:hypothetical protein